MGVALRRISRGLGRTIAAQVLIFGGGALAAHGDAALRREPAPGEAAPSVGKALRGARPAVRLAGDGVFSVAAIRGVSGRPTAVPITLPPLKSVDYVLLTIRGLPKTVSLSCGFRFEDSWAVSLSDVETLALLAPADFDGQFNLDVQLIKGQDAPPEKMTVPVEIRRRGESVGAVAGVMSQTTYAGAATRVGEGERILAPAAPASLPQKLTPKEESAMMDQGNRLLQTGDITAARMLFERIARRGSAQGAFAAALTFDPEFFRTMKVVGMKPDVKKARDWYKRSADLGNREALKRLSLLGGP